MPGRREQKRFELQQNVRTTAWSLIVERGYQDVTVEDIASGAGISAATFYRHFHSKETALTRRWLSPERLALLEPDLDREHGLAGVARSIFSSYALMTEGYQIGLMTRMKVIDADPDLRVAMAKGRAEDVSTLADLYAEVTGQPADSLAIQLAAGLTNTARIITLGRWAQLDGSLSLRRLLAEAADVLAPSLQGCEVATATRQH